MKDCGTLRWTSFLSALLLVLAAASAEAQAIRGLVVEDGTETAVPGTLVELLDQSARPQQRTYADTLGLFVLQLRRPGTYRLRLTHPFHQTVVSDTLSVGREEIVRLKLQLGRMVVPLEPLVVVTRSRDPFDGFYERAERNGFGRYLTRAELETLGAATVTSLVATVPGVRLLYVPRAPGASSVALLQLRGGCMPTIFVDGMRLGQYSDAGIDDWLRPDMLEGVEIYSSLAGLPAQFQSFSNCGAIAFWTRPGSGRAFSWKRLAIAAGAFTALFFITR